MRRQASVIVGVLMFASLGFKIYRIIDEQTGDSIREVPALEWRPFETASFKASFPGIPEQKSNEASGITLYQVIVDQPNGGAFIVGVQTLPPGVEASPEEVHEIIRKEILSALGGTATPLKPVNLGEHKCSEFILKSEDMVMNVRLYSVGREVYRVAYGSNQESTDRGTNSAKFFNSFQVVARP